MLRIALVGFGYWGKRLLKPLLTLSSSLDYFCIVDSNLQKVEKFAGHQLDFFSKLNKKVYDKIDACILAVPENVHYQLAKEALLNGKHVLVEKPLAFKYSEAKELTQMATQKKLTLMVDNTFLFDKSFLFLEEKIKKGIIGKLLKIESFRCSPNIIKPKINVLIDLFPHDLSIFSNLVDQKLLKLDVSCSSMVSRSCDSVQVRLDFDSVITYSFLSWTYPIKKRELVLYGTKGVFFWHQIDTLTDEIIYYQYNKKKQAIEKERRKIKNKDKTLQAVVYEFLQSIVEVREPRTSGRKVLPEIKILEKTLKKCSDARTIFKSPTRI